MNIYHEKGVDALKKGDTLTVGLRGWTDQGIGYAYMEDGKYVLVSKKQFDGLIKSYESFKEKCNKLPDTIRFHDLRASYATMLVSRDCNPKAVSLKLGQASERVTLDVYTERQAIILDEVDAIDEIVTQVYPKDIENDISDICIDTDKYI